MYLFDFYQCNISKILFLFHRIKIKFWCNHKHVWVALLISLKEFGTDRNTKYKIFIWNSFFLKLQPPLQLSFKYRWLLVEIHKIIYSNLVCQKYTEVYPPEIFQLVLVKQIWFVFIVMWTKGSFYLLKHISDSLGYSFKNFYGKVHLGLVQKQTKCYQIL